MNKVCILSFTLLLSVAAICQRVDLDKYNFNASYIDLPKMIIDTSYKTYFVEIDAPPVLRRDLNEMESEEMVWIEGWKKLSGKGHVKIFIQFEDIFIENVEVRERVEILKDKNGKETGRRSHFFTQLVYSFAAQSEVSDYKGNPIITINLADRDNRQTYNSQEFSSFIEASLYYKFRGIDFTKEIAKRAVRNAMSYLSNNMTYNFGYSSRTVSDFLWILDSKKHPEYEAHRKVWLVFKQAMFRMHAEEPLDEVKKSLIPVISYYETIKKRYSSNSKAHRKLRYASYFNLAKLYYYIDDPDSVMREAGELMMNDYDEKDGRRLEAAATELKMLLKQNRFSSRHFPLETEKYTGPEIVGVQQ